MNEKADIKQQIEGLIEKYFSKGENKVAFIPEMTKIPLVVPSYGWEEVVDALDSLLSTQVTMGQKVKEFESLFADYIGVKHAVMVNSGSSANLVALSILTNPVLKNPVRPGDEIITPAVTWATTVWPIINCGAVPVLVDIDPQTFNIDPSEIEKAITDKTRAIMPVHLLGNPCEMKKIMEIARKYNLYIIEDACEAHGAEYSGKKVGSFGDLATFSFFFSHHLSTIEGGMVLSNNSEFADLARALRVFGWVRDLENKDQVARNHKEIDNRYLFTNIGFNFRPMEIQGAFGIQQIKKLDDFIRIRQENAEFWIENLKKYDKYLLLHTQQQNTKHVWFGCPVTVKTDSSFSREDLVQHLESRGVETRPIMAGNIAEQPGMQLFNYRKVGDLVNSKLVMRRSFFFGNHPGIGAEERQAIVNYFEEFLLEMD